MNGKSLPFDSKEMKAFTTYIHFLSKDVPVGTKVTGQGLMKYTPPNRKVDLVAGEAIYKQTCAVCHGPDGQGVRASDVVRDASPGGYSPESVSAYNQAGVYEPSAGLVETSNVDLARQSVNMIETSRAFEANTVTIRTQDQMLGTLLDMRV